MHKTYVPRTGYLSMNPFELHKHLINCYVLTRKGATAALKRDTSRDRTDLDVLRENHKFLWEDDDVPTTWEEQLARKYYDKLFKEFCITDLSRYKENKIAMRWQTEQELITGKGQFLCGNKGCSEKEELKSWEVNFGYIEHGEKKNALVKLRLCINCSSKLNYKHKRKEIKRLKRKMPKSKRKSDDSNDDGSECISNIDIPNAPKPEDEVEEEGDDNIWKQPLENVEEPTRDEEFEKYLEHLLL